MIDYEAICADALRGLIPEVLRRFLPGPPGDHHLYITFRTDHPAVCVPAEVLAKWPREITVVLQHCYSGLSVEDEGFRITLLFGGVPKELVIAYKAVSRIHDPSAPFLAQWAPTWPGWSPIAAADEPIKIDWDQALSPIEPAQTDRGDIVQLDQFRKR